MSNTPLLLNKKNIETRLNKSCFQQNYQLHCLTSVNSTNQYLLELPSSSAIQYCIAEEQTSGRGRLGRSWHSPFGENIYLSGCWPWKKPLSTLSGLSLVIGLAIAETLKPYLKEEVVNLKWPNDIFWRQQKLGGILIEIKQHNTEETAIVIGIGLNINSNRNQSTPIEQPWCSLLDIYGSLIDRHQLTAELIIQLNHYLQRFVVHGLKPFQAEWNRMDCLKNKHIIVQQASCAQQGIARGVNDKGLLRLETDEGMLMFASGEASPISQKTTDLN